MNITAFRPMEFLPSNLKNAIKMLTFDSNSPPNIVGSFRFKVHEHPSDIDLLEIVKKDFTSIKKAKQSFVKSIQNIVSKVRDTKGIYLGDFKAGIDERFNVNIGEFKVNENGKLVLMNYNQERIRNEINAISSILSDDEKNTWIQLAVERPTYTQHKKLFSAIRKRLVLRWKIREILQGYKKLPHKKRILLGDALFQKEMIKIDIYIFIGNRFVEMTNIFLLQPIINGVDLKLVDPWNYKEFENKILTDIEVFKNPELHKHMKVVKRMWNLAYHRKNNDLSQKLYPLFNSPVSKMSQIVSDIETMILMCEKLANPPTKYMIRSLNDALLRIGTIPIELLPYKSTKIIYDKINNLNYKSNIQIMQNTLEDIYKTLNTIVDRNAKDFLQTIS